MSKAKLHLAFVSSLLALTACNVIGSQSSIDSSFRPGVAANQFNGTITYNSGNAAAFLYDSQAVSFNSGAVALTASNTADSSFSSGTASGVAWDSTRSYLRLDQTGTPTNVARMDSTWAPQWQSLVGYWTMDDASTSSTIADHSRFATHTGTLSGGVTLGNSGKLSTSATFDGSTGSISVPGLFGGPSQITVSAWVKMSAAGTNGYEVVSLGNYVGLRANNLGGGYGFYYYGTNWRPTYSAILFPVGQWNFITYSVDTTNQKQKIYVNGVLAGTTTYSDVVQYTGEGSNTIIGNHGNGGGSYFPGSIDELAIWSTVLSDTEVQTVYARQSAKYSGVYTSRVMDGFLSSDAWTNLNWKTTLPFFKSLPDAGVNETASVYSSLTTTSLMQSIVGLWHLDEAFGITAAGSVKDHSGNAPSLDGTPHNGGVTFGSGGKLNTGVILDGTQGYIDLGNPVALSFDAANVISGSAWISAYSDGAIISKTAANMTGWQFLVSSGALSFYLGNAAPGNCVDATSTALVNDGAFHHVAFTYDGSASAAGVALFIDGLPATVTHACTTVSSSAVNAIDAFIGMRNSDEYFKGQIDELAIWKRKLGNAEIAQLYRRAVNRTKFQIRTCSDATCTAGSPTWQGPSGTFSNYFSELYNTVANGLSNAIQTTSPSMLFSNFGSLTVAANRYVQYRAILESDDLGTSCNYGSGTSWCSPEIQQISFSPSPFYSTAATVVTANGIPYASVSGFAETLGVGGCANGVVYNLSGDGTNWVYWNGQTWAVSDGTAAKASAATAINTNIAAFTSKNSSMKLFVRAFLQSSGTNVCNLAAVNMTGIL